MREQCIRCGVETEYNDSTPVRVRRWYVEGSGQLCEQCYFALYPVPGSLQSNIGLYTQGRYANYSKIPIDPGSVQQ